MLNGQQYFIFCALMAACPAIGMLLCSLYKKFPGQCYLWVVMALTVALSVGFWFCI